MDVIHWQLSWLLYSIHANTNQITTYYNLTIVSNHTIIQHGKYKNLKQNFMKFEGLKYIYSLQQIDKVCIMIEKVIRHKTLQSKRDLNKFHMELYLNAQNPQNYLQDILHRSCIAKDVNPHVMNLSQLSQILTVLPINLKTKQLHQLYLFATFQPGMNARINEKRAISIVNLAYNKINLSVVSKWLQKRIQKHKLILEIGAPKTTRVHTTSSYTQGNQRISKRQIVLPKIINTRPKQRFKTQVSKVLGIFSQMEKQRQNAGLEPVCLSSDDQQTKDQPTKQIHYEGDFFEVNQKLFKLRSQAQKGIEKIIQASKYDKYLKEKFEEAMLRYQQARIEANEKIGKCGSMKAQKRMINRTKQQIKKLDKWRADTCQTELTSKYF